MAIEVNLITAIAALGVGIGAGSFWAWLGWLKSGEAFEPRKFTLGLVTGALSSVGIVLLNITGILDAVDQTQQLLAFIGLFFAVGGADTLRTGVSGAVAQRAVEETKEPEQV